MKTLSVTTVEPDERLPYPEWLAYIRGELGLCVNCGEPLNNGEDCIPCFMQREEYYKDVDKELGRC